MASRFAGHHFLLLLLLLLTITLHIPPTSGTDKQESGFTTLVSKQASSNGGQKIWCVAKPAVPDNLLNECLSYACEQQGVDCSQIQQGSSCYLPNSAIAHASYAMNMYYQAMGRNSWNCYFDNTAIVTFTDPSFGGCTYPSQ